MEDHSGFFVPSYTAPDVMKVFHFVLETRAKNPGEGQIGSPTAPIARCRGGEAAHPGATMILSPAMYSSRCRICIFPSTT